MLEVTSLCANTTTESITPLFDCLIRYAVLEFSPYLNQLQLNHVLDWCSVHTLLYNIMSQMQ